MAIVIPKDKARLIEYTQIQDTNVTRGRNTMITSEEIKRRLCDGENDLRGSMDVSCYKDYMLGLMFLSF